jgi:asparagine synthase (glutamine-hydrolysing)
MCGIIGIFHREQPIQEADQERLERVLEKLIYRGPDGKGTWASDKVLLGHRRLSIIDLSAAGAQPFVDEKLGFVITFNGEIYNYQEIRSRLVSVGYTFKSQSDTEVILNAYDHYGIDFLSHLRGMFAFCLFDSKRNTAILARDPAGEKPLYYYADERTMVFASEIKVLHAFPEADLAIDVESVKAFFSLQYIPGPHTIYQRVRKLPAGCVLEMDLDTWTWREHRYWSFENNHVNPSTPEEVDALLSQSVRYRLVADVEVGLLLSGGIDSALLASYAHRNGVKPRTFVARFDEQNLDESHYAQQVAAYLGLEQITVTGGHLTPDVFDQVIFHGDELLGDPACVPTFLLAREVSKYVKVVLSGEGADELFWGYDTYRYERIWRRFSWLRGIFSRSSRFQNIVSSWETSGQVPAGLTRLGKLLSVNYDIGAARWTSVFADHTLKSLMTSNDTQLIRLQEIEQRIVRPTQYMDPFSASLSGDLLYWLADDLLMKVDRMTMAHSVEARAPFLDPELILKALALPAKHKLKGKTGKHMLRELVEKHFPADMGRSLAWRKKHGFEVPVSSWLHQNLRECVEDRLSPAKLVKSGLLDTAFVLDLKKNFYASKGDTSLRRKIWMLLCFQSWYEMHEAGFGFRQTVSGT